MCGKERCSKLLGSQCFTSNLHNATKVALSCIVVLYLANNVHTLQCPQTEPMKHFNITKYLSTYYEMYYFGNDNFSTFHRCPVETFYEENNTYKLYGSVLSLENTDRFNWTGNFTMAPPGIFHLTQHINGETLKYDTMVLGTDYKSWLVIWSCYFLSIEEAAWIMTKKPFLVNETLPSHEYREISEVLARNNLPWSRFKRTINYNCDE